MDIFAKKTDFGLLGLSVAGITVQISMAAFGVMQARKAAFGDAEFLAKPEVRVLNRVRCILLAHVSSPSEQVKKLTDEFEGIYGTPMEMGYPDMGECRYGDILALGHHRNTQATASSASCWAQRRGPSLRLRSASTKTTWRRCHSRWALWWPTRRTALASCLAALPSSSWAAPCTLRGTPVRDPREGLQVQSLQTLHSCCCSVALYCLACMPLAPLKLRRACCPSSCIASTRRRGLVMHRESAQMQRSVLQMLQ